MIELLLNFNRTYNNSINVIKDVLRKKYPIDTVLKNGKQIRLANFNAALFIASIQKQKGIEYDIDNDMVTIHSTSMLSDNKKKIKLIGGITNGDVVNIFLKNDYTDLPVKGKTVIDIGSNIGDSLLFFALSGADRIIGLEPFPKNYEKAKKNVEINNFSDKITVLLAGCSATSGHTKIDPDYDSGVDSKLDAFDHGVNVPLLTLKNILNNYNIPNESILKMDCEGCEYETILTASNEILERFSHIIVEYHHGYKNLKKKLEECGFKVYVKKPTASGFVSSYLHVLRKIFPIKNSPTTHHNKNDLRTDECVRVDKKYNVEYVGLIHALRK